MPARTLSELTGFSGEPKIKLDRFGGVVSKSRRKGTGFFRVEKIGQRWWLIDPEGHRFLNVAVNSLKPGRGPTFRAAFDRQFRDDADWARKTAGMLRSHGFNGTGSWSDDELMKAVEPRLTYTRKLNFMSSFGHKLGVAKQGLSLIHI